MPSHLELYWSHGLLLEPELQSLSSFPGVAIPIPPKARELGRGCENGAQESRAANDANIAHHTQERWTHAVWNSYLDL